MNPLFTLGEEFRFHDSSRFRKKARDAKLRFYHSFVPVLMSLAAESCRSRAESVHLLKPYLQWGKRWKSSNFVTPDDSARNHKMRKMMSLNCSICLMPIFGVGKVYRIWTPKGSPPQYVPRHSSRHEGLTRVHIYLSKDAPKLYKRWRSKKAFNTSPCHIFS